MIKGCEFHGRKEEVKDHLEKCGYRGLPKTISKRDFQDQVCVSILYRYMHMCCVFMDLDIFKFNSFCSVWFFFPILFVLCSFICSSHSNKEISNKHSIKVNSLLYKPALNLTVRTESMGFFIFSLIHYYNHYFLYDLDQSIGI